MEKTADTSTELQKMLSGDLYNASDPELCTLRAKARQLTRQFNDTDPEDQPARSQILRQLFGKVEGRINIEPPFRCDYGCFIEAGDNLFMNFDCVILDCARITIGRNVQVGPGVHIYAATHPTDPSIRASDLENAKPVTIGDDVWIGGRAVICPGVTIGSGTTIGAGSVVTRDIPARVVAAGNPCRVIRHLDACDLPCVRK